MKTYSVKVNVTLKKSVLDPQGKTVLQAAKSLGFNQTEDLRVGKYFEASVKANNEQEAIKVVQELSGKLLVNPVIEEFNIQEVKEK